MVMYGHVVGKVISRYEIHAIIIVFGGEWALWQFLCVCSVLSIHGRFAPVDCPCLLFKDLSKTRF